MANSRHFRGARASKIRQIGCGPTTRTKEKRFSFFFFTCPLLNPGRKKQQHKNKNQKNKAALLLSPPPSPPFSPPSTAATRHFAASAKKRMRRRMKRRRRRRHKRKRSKFQVAPNCGECYWAIVFIFIVAVNSKQLIRYAPLTNRICPSAAQLVLQRLFSVGCVKS